MKLSLAPALATLALLAPLSAQEDTRPALKEYNLEKGVALDGYDPVAYFEAGGGKPTKGKKDLTTAYRGVTYRFASAEHKELFLENPAHFEPAYGGWCAYAMADGSKVEVDPKSFLIEDGRLLVFYKGFFNDTRKKWKKQGGRELAPKADKAWKKILDEAVKREKEDGPTGDR